MEYRRSKYAPIVGKPNHTFIRMLAEAYAWQLTELNW